MEAARHPLPALGVLLLRDGLVTEEELNAILESQRDVGHPRITGSRLGEIVVDRGIVSDEQVARLLAEQYELPFVPLDPDAVDPRAARALSENEARRFSALPIGRRPDGSYDVAIADPSTVVFSDQLRQALGSMPHFAVVGKQAFAAALAQQRTPRAEAHVHATAEVVGMWPEEPAPAEVAEAPYERRVLAHTWPPLGALLVRDGLLTNDELDTALAQQRLSANQRLGELLVEAGVVSSGVIARLLAEQYELPFVDLAELDVDPATVRLLSQEMSRTHLAVPFGRREDGSLDVAIADPTNVFYSDDLHVELGVPVNLSVAAPDAIAALIARSQGGVAPEIVETTEVQRTETTGHLDAAVAHALASGASEVRISARTHLTTRTVVVSRRARADLAATTGLVLEERAALLLREIMKRPGIVVVGGATGPLRALLALRGSDESPVAAIEERVEQAGDHVDSLEDDGFALSAALEALGRLELDIISVDAPLDAESAATVLRLALAGRTVLVRATEGGAALTISALIDVGEGAAPVSATVSVRHVRRLCMDCREAYYASPAELESLGLPPGHRLLARARGCDSCAGTGFNGSVAAVAALAMSGELEELARGATAETLREELSAREASALSEEAVRLCLDGLTSSEELADVLGIPTPRLAQPSG